MPVAIKGSGGGSVTLDAGAASADTTLTLPNTTGTVALTASPTFSGTTTVTTLNATTVQVSGNQALNGPVFSAYQSTLQALSAATYTTCIYQTEEYDIGGCYNNTSSTVTLNGLSVPAWCFCPNVAGYYMVNFALRAPQIGEIAPLIFKNGVSYKGGTNVATSGSNNFQGAANAIVYFNGTGDYVSAVVYSTNALNTTTGIQYSYFQACMVRGA
jgi:hypothetical protein